MADVEKHLLLNRAAIFLVKAILNRPSKRRASVRGQKKKNV
jgi:hypothetical protein